MKKAICLVILLCTILPGYGMATASGVGTYAKKYACVEDAVRDSALIYLGHGYYPDADFIIVGVSIMEQRSEGDKLIVSAFLCPATCDIDSNPPNVSGRILIPARITFQFTTPNEYTLLEFIMPGEDTMEKDCIAIFSKDVYELMYKPKDSDRYRQERLAQEDAERVAALYMANDPQAQAVGREFLKTGSNPHALGVIQISPHFTGDNRYPGFEGETVVFSRTRFRLTVEGEKSYSGILIFESEDLLGNQLSYCKVKVEGRDLVLLDGALPTGY